MTGSSGSETVAYLRLIDSCITQLKAQGPSRNCNESKEEEEEEEDRVKRGVRGFKKLLELFAVLVGHLEKIVQTPMARGRST